VEAHLLDHVDDVRAGEGEVLESRSGYCRQSGRSWCLHAGGDLGLSVD
jgi:hypothetical protein